MRQRTKIIIFLVFFAAILISACGSRDEDITLLSETPIPTATTDPSGYQTVESRSCLINEWNILQSEQRRGQTITWLQGDLLAWRPGGNSDKGELAYIAPGDRSSWFTGTLTLAYGSDLEQKRVLAKGILANGDLTWSPDGAWLAFLAYRPNEELYTVMIVNAEGTQLRDLFPADMARTDNRSSQKAIMGWKDDSTVQVIASCGEECRHAFDIDVKVPIPLELTPTVIGDYTWLKENLLISQHTLTVTPDAFPKNMVSGKWSPNERLVAYLDRRGILWMLSVDEKINYILDIGLRDVYEVQWSANNDFLAVRAEDRVFIFEIPCRKK